MNLFFDHPFNSTDMPSNFLLMSTNLYRVFGLRRRPILEEVVHHEFIPQILSNDFIPRISTSNNY